MVMLYLHGNLLQPMFITSTRGTAVRAAHRATHRDAELNERSTHPWPNRSIHGFFLLLRLAVFATLAFYLVTQMNFYLQGRGSCSRARASMTLPATKFIARPAARRGRRAGAKNYRWQQPVPQRCQPAVASTLLTRFLKSSGPNNMKLENGITLEGASEKDRSHVRQQRKCILISF